MSNRLREARGAMETRDLAICECLSLRLRARGRGPSVGLDFLVGATLELRTVEVADRLVAARVLPERESDHDDLHAQWRH